MPDDQTSQTSKVLADDLGKDNVTALVEFLNTTTTGQFAQHGTKIDAHALPRKKLKFSIHKFLHLHQLVNYGVLDTSGVLEIVRVAPEKNTPPPHENLKSTMPFWPPYNVHPVRPSEMIEWQGKPPLSKKKQRN